MGGRAQADQLRAKANGSIVAIAGEVVEADERGTAVMDQAPDAASVAAIRRLADQLLTTAA